MGTDIETAGPTEASSSAIDCVRCGYHLVGIADDQPCPECGLLVERSRQPTEHLTDASPRWLRSISRGVGLILLAHVVAVAWAVLLSQFIERYLYAWRRIRGGPGLPNWVVELVPLSGYLLATLMLMVGLRMLTRPQGRLISDAAERRSRLALRLLAFAPLLTVVALQVLVSTDLFSRTLLRYDRLFARTFASLLFLVFALIFPIMFFHLRRLAKRVLNPHLAEHAGIVGVGFSVTLLITWGFALVSMSSYEPWSKRWDWVEIAMPLFIFTFGILFGGWSALNLVRFLWAFRKAYLGANRKWRMADRSLTGPPQAT